MKIIKRSGREAEFNLDKIINAVKKANEGVIESDRLTDEQIERTVNKILKELKNIGAELRM